MNVAAAQELENIKSRITENSFPSELLNEYEFYLFNNKVDFENEFNFLSNLSSSFDTEYLQSILLFKNNNFNQSLNLLIKLLDKTPEHYPYYDLLVTTANIANKSKVKEVIDLIDSNNYKNYLNAQIAYKDTKYQEAKDLFDEVLKEDSTSFHPNYMMAYTYRNLGKYDTALKYFNKSFELVKKDSPLSAKVTIAIGSIFYLSGNYTKAKELYNSGLSIASKTNYITEKVKAILNIGMLLDLEGDIKKARSQFDIASKLAAEIGDKELEATCLSEYAVSYTYTGEETNARENYKKSFLLFKKLGNKKRLALTAVNIGNGYLNISNYKNSIKYFEIGLNVAGENVRTKMLALRGLGDVYTNLSDYAKAIDYYKKAKILAKEIQSISANAEINIGLGVLYYNLDMPNRALQLLEESDNSLIESENPYLKLEIEQKMGIIYSSVDSLSLASYYLNKSATLAKRYGDIYSEILSNTFQADILIKQKDFSSAVSLLKSTMATTTAIEYDQMLGLQFLLLSDISKFKLNVKKQIEHIKKAMFYAEKSIDYNTLITTNHKLGEIYEEKKNFSEAKKYYLTAISLIDRNFNRLFSNADIQIKFFSNYSSIYNSLINIYLSENDFVKAFDLLEKSKGKNTNQGLVNIQIGSSIESNKLLDDYYDLEWKLASGLYNAKELLSIEKELDKVKKSFTQINPDTKIYLDNNSPFSLSDIQLNLNDDQYIISYFIHENHIYAFQLSSRKLKVEKLIISSAELNELKISISPYYDNNIGGNEITFNNDLFAFNAEGSINFYENILSPIISDIPPRSKLIFSLPTQMLTIPFEFLVTESDDDSSPFLLDDKNFLINDFVISYTPSALIWSKLKNEKVSNIQRALLIGNPLFNNQNTLVAEERGIIDDINISSRNMEHLNLEYSENEILSIESVISEARTYLSENATETNFKNNVEDASIVHVSTHSFLYKNNPLILFSSSDKENDGVLELGEILNLNIKSDLIVLSSCKSGLGKVDKAEGIIGMQKAFFDAGAKSVIVSLWDVNDKYTSIFMKYFYSFLSDDIAKSEALRLAKLKFMTESNSNPYYWAAFTLSGNDLPINIQLKNNLLIFILAGLLLFLILIFYLIVQKRFKKRIIIDNI